MKSTSAVLGRKLWPSSARSVNAEYLPHGDAPRASQARTLMIAR